MIGDKYGPDDRRSFETLGKGAVLVSRGAGSVGRISHLQSRRKVDEGVGAAWEAEVAKRIAELDSGNAKTVSWEHVRQRNLAKLDRAR